MAFEPLKTDERIEGPVKPPRDMDDHMLFGCTGFVLASLLGYGLGVWPFFVIPNIDRLQSFGLACALGLFPMLILAVFVARRYALAGACGAIGGSMAVAMFLYLRIEQAFLAFMARQAPEPQYPPSLKLIVPLAWLLAIVLAALVAMPKEEDEEGSTAYRS